MATWIASLNPDRKRSAQKAKDRLKLVLIQDRVNLSAETLEILKNDLLQVISKYVAIDSSDVIIRMTQEGRSHRLVADVPIKESSRRYAG
jgi:cell division topological specificity factor